MKNALSVSRFLAVTLLVLSLSFVVLGETVKKVVSTKRPIDAQLRGFNATIKGKIFLNSSGQGKPSDMNSFDKCVISLGYEEPQPAPPGGGLAIPKYVELKSAIGKKDASGKAWAEYIIVLNDPSTTPAFLTKSLKLNGAYKGQWTTPLGGGPVQIRTKGGVSNAVTLKNGTNLVMDMELFPVPIK